MKKRSLQLKIAVWVGICIFFTSSIIIIYSAGSLRKSARKNATIQTIAKARHEITNIQININAALTAARTMAQAR
jgi:hypothetical protein